MKTLKLTEEQYNLLHDIALAEQRAIDGSITDGTMNEYQHAHAIQAYNTLADIFGFDRWEDREEPYSLGDLVQQYIDSQQDES